MDWLRQAATACGLQLKSRERTAVMYRCFTVPNCSTNSGDDSLGSLLRRLPAIGWTRGSRVASGPFVAPGTSRERVWDSIWDSASANRVYEIRYSAECGISQIAPRIFHNLRSAHTMSAVQTTADITITERQVSF